MNSLQCLSLLLLGLTAYLAVSLWQSRSKNRELDTECECLAETLGDISNRPATLDRDIWINGYSGSGLIVVDDELRGLVAQRDRLRTQNYKSSIRDEIAEMQTDIVADIFDRSYRGARRGN